LFVYAQMKFLERVVMAVAGFCLALVVNMAVPDLLTLFLYAQMKFLERVGMAVAGFCLALVLVLVVDLDLFLPISRLTSIHGRIQLGKNR